MTPRKPTLRRQAAMWRSLRERLARYLADRGAVDVLARVLAPVLFVPLLVTPSGAAQLSTDDVSDAPDTAVEAEPAPPRSPTSGTDADRASADEEETDTDVATRTMPAAANVPQEVERTPPDVIVQPDSGMSSDTMFAALRTDGIRHAVGAARFTATVRVDGDERPLEVLVVDPLAFRPLTPEVTAQSKAVWERLFAGEMMLRHDIAQQLGFRDPGERVDLEGPGGSADVRIGAFASNGTPPVAEAVVPWQVGSDLGVIDPNLLIVAVDDGRDPEEVADRIVERLDGGEFRLVTPPDEQEAVLRGAGSHRFEPFSYIDHGDGMITIDSSWVRKWIVSAEVPVFGTVRCHRVMIPQLRAALADVKREGLAHLIDTSQYGGCWVPRHILFDPSRPLSMHAWGLAIDFNVSTNQYGARPQMDRRIVEIFQKWGFSWGGRWSTPDGMHFELGTVIQGSDET